MKNFYALIATLFLVNGAMAQWYPQTISWNFSFGAPLFFTSVETGYGGIPLAKTIDGGANWFISDSAIIGSTIFFISSDTGWVGTDWRTTDGGLTWSQCTGATHNVSSIFFTDKDTGYAVGGWGGYGGYKYIAKTTNGGMNWFTLMDPSGQPLNSVCFTNAIIGYAIGYGTIIKTIDGGLTWIAQQGGENKWLNQVSFPAPDTGYIVGDNGTILKTTTGGNDWISLTSGTSKDLFSVFFTDVSTGYAVGTDGYYNGYVILKTIDGGSSWWSQSINGTGNYSQIGNVFFPVADTGYILGVGFFLKTTNGGGTVVGINDNYQTTNSLTINPNPASSIITIETTAKGSLFINNIRGQQLLQQQINKPVTTIDVSKLPNGIYMVKVAGEKGVQVGKFVKQ